jgi:hypothetical protein
MRYPDGGGLTAAKRARRERVQLAAVLDADRQAAGQDKAAITRWKEADWPVLKDGGEPGRLVGLRRRVRPGG